MKGIKKIAYAFRLFLIRRLLKKQQREKKVVAYHEANAVCILFDAESTADGRDILALVSRMKEDHKEVYALGYRCKNERSAGNDPLQGEMIFCGKRDFSPLLRPRPEALQRLVKKPFDILIDLTPPGSQRMKSIAARSAARYKAGAHHVHYLGIYDLILNVPGNCKAFDLAQHMVHYLKIIKKAGTHD